MKKSLLCLAAIFAFQSITSQEPFFATVLDEHQQPLARGWFQSAVDSGIILLVDKMEILVLASEISVLKIEKNPSRAQFVQLSAVAAGESIAYLISRSSEDSAVSDGQDEALTETKEKLLARLEPLITALLSGTHDVASIKIGNSAEKFASMLRLLQQYSHEDESYVSAATPDDDTPDIETEEIAEDPNSSLEPTTPPAVKNPTFSKGIVLISGPTSKPRTISAAPKPIKVHGNTKAKPAIKKTSAKAFGRKK